MAEHDSGVDSERQALLEHLQRHRVEGIVIGGVAIQTHRPAYRTDDVDFAPATDPANLRRLAAHEHRPAGRVARRRRAFQTQRRPREGPRLLRTIRNGSTTRRAHRRPADVEVIAAERRVLAGALSSPVMSDTSQKPHPQAQCSGYAGGEMGQYSFLSTWCVNAPLGRVWDVLSNPAGYPEWWKGVRKATVLEPGADGGNGVGTLYRFEWRSKLPYSLVFDSRVTRVEAPHLLEGQASGELAGVGAWRLYEGALGTAAIYSWDVRTTRAWMNALGPLARPAFAWNHDYVMRQGADGLAKRLGAELVAAN